MVVAGKIRGNAPQLASYLLAQGTNERITILDVDGRSDADASYFKDMLYSMELNSEMTRSDNSVYHAYINPNPYDTTDRAMTMEEWQQSVDILTKELGYEDQRRVVVLHEKPGGRTHAHIVYERYNHERGIMATYEHNYKAHDRARAEMEKELNHTLTPQKNKKHDHHKQVLTEIWQRTSSAQEFIREAEAEGYKVAKGTERPFKVVDADGVSFDLVRKLDGTKSKDVKTRFADIQLISEKEAIRDRQTAMQQPQSVTQEKAETIKMVMDTRIPEREREAEERSSKDREEARRQQFIREMKEAKERNRSNIRDITLYLLIALKVSFSFKGQLQKIAKPELVQEPKTSIAEQFVVSALGMTAPKLTPSEKTIVYQKALESYKHV